ncbi:MAG: hypothetical protein AAGJ31_02345 [Verrucomicrobiota bacterium]
MELLKQLGRTILQMIVLGATIFLFIYLSSLIKLPASVIVIGVIAITGAYIYFSARWHAYWAPISKTVHKQKWKGPTGEAMETVVENAIVQAGSYVRAETLRVSIYDRQNKRRVARIMVGDDARFLGSPGMGFWFYIADKFHARLDGLVCLDIRKGTWIYHKPKSEISEVELTRTSVISFEDAEGNKTSMDLKAQEPTQVG